MSSKASKPCFDLRWRMPLIPGLSALAFNHKRGQIFTADSGSLKLWNFHWQDIALNIPLQSDTPVRAAFFVPSADSFMLLQGANEAVFLEGQGLEQTSTGQFQRRQVLAACYFEEHEQVLTVSADGQFVLQQVTSHTAIIDWKRRLVCELNKLASWTVDAWITCLRVDKVGSHALASAGRDILAFDWKTGTQKVWSKDAHATTVTCLNSFGSLSELRIVSGCAEGHLKIWAMPLEEHGQLEPYMSLFAHQGAITTIVCDKHLNGLYSLSVTDDSVKCWQVETASLISTHRFSQGGDCLLPKVVTDLGTMVDPPEMHADPYDLQHQLSGAFQLYSMDTAQVYASPRKGHSVWCLVLWRGPSLSLFNATSKSTYLSATNNSIRDLNVIKGSEEVCTLDSLLHFDNGGTSSDDEDQYPSAESKAGINTLAVAFCSDNLFEIFDVDRGCVHNVLAPEVARTEFLKRSSEVGTGATSGGIVKKKNAKKKKRRKRKAPKLQGMSADEKRSFLVKRIMNRLQKEKDKAERRVVKKPTDTKSLNSSATPLMITPVESAHWEPLVNAMIVLWQNGVLDVVCLRKRAVIASFEEKEVSNKVLCASYLPGKYQLGSRSTANEKDDPHVYDFHIVTAMSSGMMRVWAGAPKGVSITQFKVSDCAIKMMKFDQASKILICISGNCLRIVHPSYRRVLGKVRVTNADDPATCIEWIALNRLFLIGFKSGRAMAVRIPFVKVEEDTTSIKPSLAFTMEHVFGPIDAIKVSQDQCRCLTVVQGHQATVWKLDNGSMERALTPDLPLQSADFADNYGGVILAAGGKLSLISPLEQNEANTELKMSITSLDEIDAHTENVAGSSQIENEEQDTLEQKTRAIEEFKEQFLVEHEEPELITVEDDTYDPNAFERGGASSINMTLKIEGVIRRHQEQQAAQLGVKPSSPPSQKPDSPIRSKNASSAAIAAMGSHKTKLVSAEIALRRTHEDTHPLFQKLKTGNFLERSGPKGTDTPQHTVSSTGAPPTTPSIYSFASATDTRVNQAMYLSENQIYKDPNPSTIEDAHQANSSLQQIHAGKTASIRMQKQSKKMGNLLKGPKAQEQYMDRIFKSKNDSGFPTAEQLKPLAERAASTQPWLIEQALRRKNTNDFSLNHSSQVFQTNDKKGQIRSSSSLGFVHSIQKGNYNKDDTSPLESESAHCKPKRQPSPELMRAGGPDSLSNDDSLVAVAQKIKPDSELPSTMFHNHSGIPEDSNALFISRAMDSQDRSMSWLDEIVAIDQLPGAEISPFLVGDGLKSALKRPPILRCQLRGGAMGVGGSFVILKSVNHLENSGFHAEFVDSLKQMFGLSSSGCRRYVFDHVAERPSKGNSIVQAAKGTIEIRDCSSEGGHPYIVMTDYTRGFECATVANLIGELDGTGPLFTNRATLLKYLEILAFRTALEVDPCKPTDVVVLPSSELLSVGESSCLTGKYALSRISPALRKATGTLCQQLQDRISHWFNLPFEEIERRAIRIGLPKGAGGKIRENLILINMWLQSVRQGGGANWPSKKDMHQAKLNAGRTKRHGLDSAKTK